MARVIFLVFLISYVSCMEMRETVKRMVMVRTTGSDLQPAATGFLYKKESDGPVSVIKMGESEVVEHLSKLYEQPKSFAAPFPIAAGPFYSEKEEDKYSGIVSSEAKIIPVVENQEEQDTHIDGIANEDYTKILEEYASKFGNYKSDFDDYLKSLGYFDERAHLKYADENDYDTYGHHENDGARKDEYRKNKKSDKEGDGDFHSAKYESYEVSKENEKNNDYSNANNFGSRQNGLNDYRGNYHGYKPGNKQVEAVDAYHNFFDKEKDQIAYDGVTIKEPESDNKQFESGSSLSSVNHDVGLGEGSYHDKIFGKEDKSAFFGGQGEQYPNGDFGDKDGKHYSRSYGYQIKH